MAGMFGGYMDPIDAFGQGATGGMLNRVTNQLWLPVDQYLSAQASVSSYLANQEAWRVNPCILPSPDVLFDLDIKGYFKGSNILLNALRQHGITSGIWGADTPGQIVERRKLWNAIASLKKQVPDAMWMLDVWRRRLFSREEDVLEAIERSGGDFDSLSKWADTLDKRPDVYDILRAVVRDRLDPDEAELLLIEAGTRGHRWAKLMPSLETIPSPGELLSLANRLNWTGDKLEVWLKRNGIKDQAALDMYKELRFGIPGISDLLRMGSRLLFTPEAAGKYGLYDGFQEESRPFFRQLGLDYPLGFVIPVDGEVREATLPDLYWGATREILPLGMAFTSYQRFRPSQVAKYRDEVPNLRPFEIEDLRLHMRVAGYPPPMQDYLIALSHPPLGRRDIPQAMQYGGKDRDWAYGQYLNLGLRPDDASIAADTQLGRVRARESAWIVSLEQAARKRTVSEIEGMYDEGILDRGQALSQLALSGLPDALSLQLLDLSDARRSRALLRTAVTETGRDYLAGILSAAETLSALRQLGIREQRAGELMQIWTVRRSRRRKQADTSRILKWVGEGRLTVEDARKRLTNLGWTDPDLMMLLAEGEGKLAALRAKAEQAEAKGAAARAKELEKLARESDTEAKRIRTEANRVAPRSVLTRWLVDGIISRDEYYQSMKDRGYPENVIDDYYRDATDPRPARPKVVPAARATPKGGDGGGQSAAGT